MKFIIAVATVTFIYAAQASDSCLGEAGIDKQLVSKLLRGEFSKENHIKKFVFCAFKKAGVVTEKGEWNIDSLKSKIAPSLLKSDIEKAMANCKDTPGKNIFDKVYRKFECYKKQMPKQI